MLTPEQAKENVARGAAFLDQRYPGWEDRIDLGTLTLSSCTQCVLGQLIPGFHWENKLIHERLTFADATACGFMMRGGDEFAMFLKSLKDDYELADRLWYQPLQDAWVALIVERRARKEVVGPAVEQPEAEFV